MSLTEFVKLNHVKNKFEFEFNNPYKDRIKIYRRSKEKGPILKENVGISIVGIEGEINLICDSFGRKKPIFSFEDLIGFFTYHKYSNTLCWFYCSGSDFESIVKYLPAQHLNDLLSTNEIEYYAYKILFLENRHIFIKNVNTNYTYKIYNLFPLFNPNLDANADKFLKNENLDTIDRTNRFIDDEYWDENYDDIVENCKNRAKLVKEFADYYTKKNEQKSTQYIRPKIVHEPKTPNSREVGTAFDYLLRFVLKAENPSAITHRWVAYRSLESLEGNEKERAISLLIESEELYSSFLETKEINDDLIKSTLYLAKLEAVYRSGFSLQEIGLAIDSRDITDLRNLINGVPKELIIAKKCCILNPGFGIADNLTRGADADLLIDNTFIDIKTTKDHNFSNRQFHQLMGYVVLQQLGLLYLNNIHKVDAIGLFDDMAEEKFNLIFEKDLAFLNAKIEKIGIYFSRFNQLFTLDLNEIVPEGKINWELLAWFEKEAHRHYKPTSIKKYFGKIIERKLRSKKVTIDELLHPDVRN
ncbi:hypothetical protein [Methanocalculus sp.]|uniref:hypothetical protein n=1 Tax=Methanocalculus sp. TaxID=2004547 RepID=UPI00261970F4|nr:hypothetical protein [Methanocalculus sp.]MDG6251028.1 hypothetical protein [Methanocalculus sp.]